MSLFQLDPLYATLNPGYKCRRPQTSLLESANTHGLTLEGQWKGKRTQAIRYMAAHQLETWLFQNKDPGAPRPGVLTDNEVANHRRYSQNSYREVITEMETCAQQSQQDDLPFAAPHPTEGLPGLWPKEPAWSATPANTNPFYN